MPTVVLHPSLVLRPPLLPAPLPWIQLGSHLSVTVVTQRSVVTLRALYLLNKVPNDHKALINFRNLQVPRTQHSRCENMYTAKGRSVVLKEFLPSPLWKLTSKERLRQLHSKLWDRHCQPQKRSVRRHSSLCTGSSLSPGAVFLSTVWSCPD